MAEKAEAEHVGDWQQWVESEGKPLAQKIEDAQNPKPFKFVAECNKSADAAFRPVMDSYEKAKAKTIKRMSQAKLMIYLRIGILLSKNY